MSSGNTDEKDRSKTPTPTTIKIAAKDAAARAANGGADPGPGDMAAEPSEMPEPVNVPRPPTDSELVVKSSANKSFNSRQIKTINDPVSLPKSRKSSASTRLQASGSGASQAKSGSGGGGGPGASAAASGMGSGGRSGSGRPKSGSGGQAEESGGAPESRAAFEGSAKGVTESGSRGKSGAADGAGASSMGAVKTLKTASGTAGGPSAAMQPDSQSGASADPGQEHDEEEEGEGEVETAPSPSPGPSTGGGPTAGPSGTQGPVSPDVTEGQPSGGVDSAPASSGGGSSKMSPKTSAVSKKSTSISKPVSASSASSASSHGSSHHHHHHHHHKHGHDKKKKKVTKFRYHKRITVRTHGKTSPASIMHKVNKKDHKAGITPSTIEDMDTEELMKRAGIKGKKNAHWRVRLRQTKRMTQNGKTVVQTKIAYRDSEGNKRVKTSMTPDCKNCGKKLEDCKCDEK